MFQENIIVGQSEVCNTIVTALENLTGKSKPSILLINGETALGKTHILKYFHEAAKDTYSLQSIYFQCEAPIGKINVGNIQPLQPFIKAIDVFKLRKGFSAKKKFYVKASMSLLSAIPLLGDVIAAVKDIGRDYREYKFDEVGESDSLESTTLQDFYNALGALTQDAPAVIFIDDFHFSDPQSIALLNMFAMASPMPLSFVISYKKSVAESISSPLVTFIAEHTGAANVSLTELFPMATQDINKFCKLFFEHYIPNDKFETWIYNHSFGTPGVIIEYLKYFKKYSPFNPDGTLNPNFGDTDYLPSSVHSAFSHVLDTLSEDEKNLLAVCSAEGREFTALVISELIRTDLLQTIRMLRSVQNKTGIIRSIGAQMRYGSRTTVYEFTQALYYSHFENMLEYEEKVALHGHIASMLKQLYDSAENESVRRQIAPYLAGHSSESGDDDTTKSMLVAVAEAAKELGSGETVQTIFDEYKNISQNDDDEDAAAKQINAFQEIFRTMPNFNFDVPEATAAPTQAAPAEITASAGESFLRERNHLANMFHERQFKDVSDRAIEYYEMNKVNLRHSEQLQLLTIATKALIEFGNFSGAEQYANMASDALEKGVDVVSECMFLNVYAILRLRQRRVPEARGLLEMAAKKSVYLPPEMKLLTLANVALFKAEFEPGKEAKYFAAVEKLARSLDFKEFADDVLH